MLGWLFWVSMIAIVAGVVAFVLVSRASAGPVHEDWSERSDLDRPVERITSLEILVEVSGLDRRSKRAVWTDVTSSHYSLSRSERAALRIGRWRPGRPIVQGFADGTFRARDPVTFGQWASILHRAYFCAPLTDRHIVAFGEVIGYWSSPVVAEWVIEDLLDQPIPEQYLRWWLDSLDSRRQSDTAQETLQTCPDVPRPPRGGGTGNGDNTGGPGGDGPTTGTTQPGDDDTTSLVCEDDSEPVDGKCPDGKEPGCPEGHELVGDECLKECPEEQVRDESNTCVNPPPGRPTAPVVPGEFRGHPWPLVWGSHSHEEGRYWMTVDGFDAFHSHDPDKCFIYPDRNSPRWDQDRWKIEDWPPGVGGIRPPYEASCPLVDHH